VVGLAHVAVGVARGAGGGGRVGGVLRVGRWGGLVAVVVVRGPPVGGWVVARRVVDVLLLLLWGFGGVV